jgi:hypothetical protein
MAARGARVRQSPRISADGDPGEVGAWRCFDGWKKSHTRIARSDGGFLATINTAEFNATDRERRLGHGWYADWPLDEKLPEKCAPGRERPGRAGAAVAEKNP